VLPTASVSGEAQAEQGLKLPAPQVADVLFAIPAVELSALEHGLQQFLSQLEQLGQPLPESRDRTDLYVWIVTGIAAAVACAIAHRQLRRRAPALAEAVNPWSGKTDVPFLS
jgi:hypothetical protein